jgi:hypothetical protein
VVWPLRIHWCESYCYLIVLLLLFVVVDVVDAVQAVVPVVAEVPPPTFARSIVINVHLPPFEEVIHFL